MRKKRLLLFLLCFAFIFPFFNVGFVAKADPVKVYLGGMPAGFSVTERGAHIIGLSDVITEKGLLSPAKDSELLPGDIILSIDGEEVNSASDLKKCCEDGEIKILTVKRGENIFLRDIIPAPSLDGSYKLGVLIRDAVNGIGTISFIKDGNFASLGHPILDDDNKILKLSDGNIYNATISGYISGERGRAGELRGSFAGENIIGDIKLNLISGVYGTLKEDFDYSGLTEIEIGTGTIGKAEIYSTINGKDPLSYSVSLLKADPDAETKNFVIRIDDERLLSSTGGIVQGMSGSPIVQNGKLIGAVTHVFINDPKMGYGISVQNMYNHI